MVEASFHSDVVECCLVVEAGFYSDVVECYLLLSPYYCFNSLLYLDLYVLGDDALIS